MLDPSVQKKLESLSNLPAIPAVASAVLQEVDNPKLSAAALASMIERDPALTARVLAVANSPFYGFMRRIATVELAVVVLGMRTVKELVLSLIVQRVFAHSRTAVLDINAFWHYSVFCGTSARFLARKLGYRVAGEAFVAGLMHDVGVLIQAHFFTKEFEQVRAIQLEKGCTFLEAEKQIFNCTHADIGAWFAEQWKLPAQLREAILLHHEPQADNIAQNMLMEQSITTLQSDSSPAFPAARSQNSNAADTPFAVEQNVRLPLTALVGMSEIMASDMGHRKWSGDIFLPSFYLPGQLIEQMQRHFGTEREIDDMKQKLTAEYENAVEFTKQTA
jgi:HD-like signal output (HDOD) protein